MVLLHHGVLYSPPLEYRLKESQQHLTVHRLLYRTFRIFTIHPNLHRQSFFNSQIAEYVLGMWSMVPSYYDASGVITYRTRIRQQYACHMICMLAWHAIKAGQKGRRARNPTPKCVRGFNMPFEGSAVNRETVILLEWLRSVSCASDPIVVVLLPCGGLIGVGRIFVLGLP